MRGCEVGGGWVCWGSEKCKVVRGGTSRKENLGEVGQLGIRRAGMEGRVRRRILVESLLFRRFVLASHGRGGRCRC